MIKKVRTPKIVACANLITGRSLYIIRNIMTITLYYTELVFASGFWVESGKKEFDEFDKWDRTLTQGPPTAVAQIVRKVSKAIYLCRQSLGTT